MPENLEDKYYLSFLGLHILLLKNLSTNGMETELLVQANHQKEIKNFCDVFKHWK